MSDILTFRDRKVPELRLLTKLSAPEIDSVYKPPRFKDYRKPTDRLLRGATCTHRPSSPRGSGRPILALESAMLSCVSQEVSAERKPVVPELRTRLRAITCWAGGLGSRLALKNGFKKVSW